jgi:hypothetical protein
MQVLCKLSTTVNDVQCSVCGQGFVVYWERHSPEEQEEARQLVMQQLAEHHRETNEPGAHPVQSFNVPQWAGLPKFSGAALLGGAPEWAL